MTTAPPAAAPPAAVTCDLTRLESALDAAIPARTNDNLLIAIWNIRAFGDLTAKWAAGPADSESRQCSWRSTFIPARFSLGLANAPWCCGPRQRKPPPASQNWHACGRFAARWVLSRNRGRRFESDTHAILHPLWAGRASVGGGLTRIVGRRPSPNAGRISPGPGLCRRLRKMTAGPPIMDVPAPASLNWAMLMYWSVPGFSDSRTEPDRISRTGSAPDTGSGGT
ncbi:hypothetical protein QFZ79_001266 [Arthrobacter sp. V4I6]|nr:hypothetical protein [Arthrobacter sp. V1I7]MDQ0853155.1 hypothetical protein [Arthrobacter sp. V4I6]